MELPIFSQKETLRKLGISYNELRKLELEGKIRVARLSSKILRYFASDIDNLIEEREKREEEKKEQRKKAKEVKNK